MKTEQLQKGTEILAQMASLEGVLKDLKSEDLILTIGLSDMSGNRVSYINPENIKNGTLTSIRHIIETEVVSRLEELEEQFENL